MAEEEEYDTEEGLDDLLDDLGEYSEEAAAEEAYEEEREIEAEPEEAPPKKKKGKRKDFALDASLEEAASLNPIKGRLVDFMLIIVAVAMVAFFLSTRLYESVDKITSLEMGMLLNIGFIGLVVIVLLYIQVSSFIAKGDALCRLDTPETYKGAIEKYNAALNIERRSKKAWTGKGLAMRMASHEKNNLMEALKYHNRALKIDQDYGVAWVNKGNVLFNLGKNEEALKCYDKAIALDPDYTVAWVNKGEMLVKMGKRKEAQKCLDRARSLAD